LPGGALNSSTLVAMSMDVSFATALSRISPGTAFDLRPLHNLSVSLSAKLFITALC
jgi:hypothetical protein